MAKNIKRKGRKYIIPELETVEIVNPNSKYFRQQGWICSVVKGSFVVSIGKYEDTCDSDDVLSGCFERNEILPPQNILAIEDLKPTTLAKIFDREYLYETNRVVVYYKEFSLKTIEKEYYKLAASIAKGKCLSSCDEKVLMLLNEMRRYDKEELYIPMGEVIDAEQWWIEGLRKHCYTQKCRKKARFLETENFTVDFIKIA